MEQYKDASNINKEYKLKEPTNCKDPKNYDQNLVIWVYLKINVYLRNCIYFSLLKKLTFKLHYYY